MIVLLPVEHLKALMISCSKEETRYYLRGVFIDPQGFAVTTDGDRMTIVALKQPDFGTQRDGIIVPREAIDKLLKMVDPRNLAPIAIHFDGKSGSISHDDVSIKFEPIDGTYPQWQRVVPAANNPETPGCYDTAYLADLEKQAKLLGGRGFNLKQAAVDASEVTFEDDSVRAILMPMRCTVPSRKPLSDWVSSHTIRTEEDIAA